MSDWLDNVAQREARQIESEQLAKRNAETVSAQMSGLWRTFRNDFVAEINRYRAIVPLRTIHHDDSNFSELAAHTQGSFPAVALRVSCCGPEGAPQFDYAYTVAKNHDVTPKQHHGRLIVYANGNDVFIKTPEGQEFPTTKDAAGYLLDKFDLYARGQKE